MYLYRKVSAYLEHWKADKYRKPLIIQGARQVGKTYAVLEFGKKNYVCWNLEKRITIMWRISIFRPILH